MGYSHLNKLFDARENFWKLPVGGKFDAFSSATRWIMLPSEQHYTNLPGNLTKKIKCLGGLPARHRRFWNWLVTTNLRTVLYIYILILTMLRDTICFSFNTLIHILWCILFFSGSCVALERRILFSFWSHVYQNLASLQDLHKHTYASRCKCIKTIIRFGFVWSEELRWSRNSSNTNQPQPIIAYRIYSTSNKRPSCWEEKLTSN